jgi:hypothetical protein
MIETQNQHSVEPEPGNSTKPLLCDGLLDKIMGVKILRPISIPIICAFLFMYIIIDYIFNIEE